MGFRTRLERRINHFLSNQISVRRAVSVIVTLTLIVVVGSGILMWAIDHGEYPNIGRGMWWSVQTVTTVGYGDVTPQNLSGRLVGVIVMLWGVAFVSITVAAITSTFVSRATRLHAAEAQAEAATDEDSAQARYEDLTARLERIEQALARRGS